MTGLPGSASWPSIITTNRVPLSPHCTASTKMLEASSWRVLVSSSYQALWSLSNLSICLADGITRLYRNYDPRTELPLQLVTSFRALNSLIPMKRGAGLVLEWQQGPGIILAGGDSKIIRAWDAHRETSIVVSCLCGMISKWYSPKSIFIGYWYRFRKSSHITILWFWIFHIRCEFCRWYR